LRCSAGVKLFIAECSLSCGRAKGINHKGH
jgi:hypothetical protein